MIMASGTRRRSDTPPSNLVFSDVHVGRPCKECSLCKEVQAVYTHPAKWKSQETFAFIRTIEPTLAEDSCICRNCRDNIASGERDPTTYLPRWKRQSTSQLKSSLCEVPDCKEAACRVTKLATRDFISKLLHILPTGGGPQTSLCAKHYRVLHKELNPENYAWNCKVCCCPVKASSFRTCTEPEIFQNHLNQYADFSGTISGSDKLCMACYRYSLSVIKQFQEKPVTSDEEFNILVTQINNSLPTLPLSIDEEGQLIDIALTLTAISIANGLQMNRATTLPCAYSQFLINIDTLLPMCDFEYVTSKKTPRWLLGQLSTLLKHHMSYTCIIKKHGIIMYRQGRELHALSNALFSARAKKESTDTHEVLLNLNKKVHKLIHTTLTANPALDINQLYSNIDPNLWEAICILTQTLNQQSSPENSKVKMLRCLFILHQIMFCADNRCSSPFQLLNADLIAGHGGSVELMKIMNRLGVCVSYNTLKRHIADTLLEQEKKGLLLGLNPTSIIVFTVDNIDFAHGYAQVYCGNQNLSWHGTTLQAVLTKPSLQSIAENRRRPHALLSPPDSPDRQLSSAPKRRNRARTGKELQSREATAVSRSSSYVFHSQSLLDPVKQIAISDFRLYSSEKLSVDHLLSQFLTYCLIKNGLTNEKSKKFLGFQDFVGVYLNSPAPNVGQVKYISMLDEIADSKDTVLHVISELYANYMMMHDHKFLVLEGDAKVYEVIQDIKYEYGKDLDWLIPFPGDWHFLKNYQLCLMKPFFEAGLRDLAIASGYPGNSIEHSWKFKRTHRFLLEAWESLFRHMLDCFMTHKNSTSSVESMNTDEVETERLNLDHTLKDLDKYQHDKVALYSVIRSLQEQIGGTKLEDDFFEYVKKKSDLDDTWKFWKGFVFQDCLAYIGLFMAIRSENWELRMASLKSMAANFTAFDHPIYQKLISNHLVDVFNMPPALLQYFQNGGFALSISGRALHSVGLDECHEMLFNRHAKETLANPSREYVQQYGKYIPTRIKNMKLAQAQYLSDDHTADEPVVKSIVFPENQADSKSEQNIQCQIAKIVASELLPDCINCNRGLINPFRNLKANAAQTHDLINFHKIGSSLFENRVEAYILKKPSAKVPMKRKKLLTLSSTKKANKKAASLEREMRIVQKCMRRKIAFASKTGGIPDVMGEQYIELPRALCDINGMPVKGQKSLVTNYYKRRYADLDLIMDSFPPNWVPDTVVLEGMFFINIKPLSVHKTMAQYGHFLLQRYINPHFRKGCKELHLLFDSPGKQKENPKIFEQARRDRTQPADHLCHIFFDDAEVPAKWQEMVQCRKCKRAITIFLSAYMSHNVSLNGTQKFVTSGATEGSSLEVTKDAGAIENEAFDSNMDESDTRVWLHAISSAAGPNKFILSPDTDVYHIGLPLITPSDKVIVQLSKPTDKHLRLLDLTLLADALKRDPHLVHILDHDVLRTVQSLFVSTGCDYISFFTGISKAYFFQVFFEHALFIIGSQSGSLSTVYTSFDLQQQAKESLLPFIRLVGCAYFKKHANAFFGTTPDSLYHSFSGASSPYQQHQQWLDHIRQHIWDRISQECESIPSFTALQLHWMRSCWVLHSWQQALCNAVVLTTLNGNGWLMEADGNLSIQWDTEENLTHVREKVMLLMNGCGCRSGCTSRRCRCKKRNQLCGPGCRCVECKNLPADSTPERNAHHTIAGPDTTPNASLHLSDTDILEVPIEDIMNGIFGASSPETENNGSSDEDSNSEDGNYESVNGSASVFNHNGTESDDDSDTLEDGILYYVPY